MAGSVNKVILVGNLGKDPEARSTQNGQRIVNFSLATSESWKDRDGARKERTEWHTIVVFDERLAEVAEKYLKKGAKVYVEGALQTRKWTDQSGQDRYTTEVVLQKFRGNITMLGDAGGGGGGRREDDRGGQRQQSGGGGGRADEDDLNDSIPFNTNELAADPAYRKHKPIL